MSTRTDLAAIHVASPVPEPTDGSSRSQWGLTLLAPLAVGCAVAAVIIVARAHRFGAADAIRLVLAVAFASAGVALVRQRQTHRLGVVTLAAVTSAGIEFLAAAWIRRFTDAPLAEALESIAATLVVAIAFQLLLTLPDGRFPSVSARNLAVAGYVSAVMLGLVRWSQQPDPAPVPIVIFAVVACLAGFGVAHHSYGEVLGVARQRMQWLGLAFAMCAEASLVLVALRVLTGWPSRPAPAAAASLVLVAAALVGAASPRLVGRVDRLLSHAVSIAGLSAIVTMIYLCVVVGLGRVPTDDDKRIIALSIAAAAIAAFAYVGARTRLTVFANRLVYGDERDPGEALDTFGSRLTRALPMEELLLQLAELCKKHMALKSSDVWTGVGGQLSLAASVPDRGECHIELDPKQLPVVTRARVSGRGWAEVWLPQLLAGRGSGALQVVPMTHGGQLFGLLVLEREQGDDDFNEEEGRVVTELARQVALALHNSELDTALRATLDEVQRKNIELQESRARIVATADAERRKIERNLHDGAQQHLVALAVKLRLIQRVGENDPAQAMTMLEDARNAALATVEEVRSLAHGIYPPLLMEKGLGEALHAAAGRSALPTSVVVGELGRYPQDVEAAVYFCCMEALQNAGKHAGEGASVTVDVDQVDGELRFSVRDDGAGFDNVGRPLGHGFVNMADRLGAIGGKAEVTSSPGEGTCVSGRVPVMAMN